MYKIAFYRYSYIKDFNYLLISSCRSYNNINNNFLNTLDKINALQSLIYFHYGLD